MLSRNTVRELLGPFHLSLSDDTIDKLLEYLGLLLRWNRKINLTAIRTPEECITRHFGESLFLCHAVRLHGRLLDIGSGAGFPGLALKLISPGLEVILLEPVAKKRAFLKEVARTCTMDQVRILASRVEEFSRQTVCGKFNVITARAVGSFESLIPAAAGLLKPEGHLCLWVGSRQVVEVCTMSRALIWQEPVYIPMSEGRQILTAQRGRPESY